MHTVAGATSIAGLKKWAAQQQPSAEGAAPHQYVAVASDACNIEFDFLGRPQGQTRRPGSGRAGSRRALITLAQGSVSAPKQSHGRVGPRSGAVQPLQGAAQGAEFIAFDPPGKVQTGGHSVVPSIGDLSRRTG